MLCALVGAAGLTAFGLSLTLPQTQAALDIGVAVRWTVAAAGLLIMVVAARLGPAEAPGWGVFVLGSSVLAYPTLLGLAAADVGGRAVTTVASAGHVLPLTMVQLVPVLVSSEVTARSRRGWAYAVLGVAAVGAAVTGVALAVEADGGPLLLVASLLWFGSFALAPVACWGAVRGTVGRARRRGIVAGLASLVPAIIIGWCLTLGGLGSALAVADDPATTALFLGFAAATTGCALLSAAALGRGDSLILSGHVVVGLMRAMVVAAVVLVASGVALATISLLPSPAAAVPVAVGATVLLGWGATRPLAWAAAVVDPAAELRLELEGVASQVTGRYRQAAQSVVRSLSGDDHAVLAFRVENDTWVDVEGRALVPDVSRALVLARERDEDAVLFLSRDSRAARHASTWVTGDPVLQQPLMEAREAWHAARAAAAAEEERARLQQDLHDGLQV